MKIAVYCGSRMGRASAYEEAASALGHWIAANGHTLVYGGGNIGLMGVVADTVLADGGRVIGVIPEFLLEHEKGHEGLHTLEIVSSMSERKNRMIELADLYVALPGGPGTLEEIAEVISLRRLHLHDKPCVLFNCGGYYEPLRALFAQMCGEGFLPAGEDGTLVSLITVPEDLSALLRG